MVEDGGGWWRTVDVVGGLWLVACIFTSHQPPATSH
jgi:hypothetical protein